MMGSGRDGGEKGVKGLSSKTLIIRLLKEDFEGFEMGLLMGLLSTFDISGGWLLVEGTGLVDKVFSFCSPSPGHYGLKGVGHSWPISGTCALVLLFLLRTCPFLSLSYCLSDTSTIGHCGVALTLHSSLMLDLCSKVV